MDVENGRIVMREFGHEKRLSELEKKRLHSLLNRKAQCTSDICPLAPLQSASHQSPHGSPAFLVYWGWWDGGRVCGKAASASLGAFHEGRLGLKTLSRSASTAHVIVVCSSFFLAHLQSPHGSSQYIQGQDDVRVARQF